MEMYSLPHQSGLSPPQKVTMNDNVRHERFQALERTEKRHWHIAVAGEVFLPITCATPSLDNIPSPQYDSPAPIRDAARRHPCPASTGSWRQVAPLAVSASDAAAPEELCRWLTSCAWAWLARGRSRCAASYPTSAKRMCRTGCASKLCAIRCLAGRQRRPRSTG